MRRFLLLIVCLLWAAPVFAQTTPILATDFDAASPYGADSFMDNGTASGYWTLEIVPGGSPSGNSSLKVTMHQVDCNPYPCQRQFGPRWTSSVPNAPAQGSTRYVRFRVKFYDAGLMNWRSDATATGESPNNRTAPDKLFILGNNTSDCGTGLSRVITHLRADYPDRDTPFIKTEQGTLSPPASSMYETVADQWLSVQIAIQSSSTAAAADASIKTYINNDTVGSPTHTHSGEVITTHGWGTDGGSGCEDSHIVFGDGSANALSDLDASTYAVYELADFEYDDEFDANWYGGLTADTTDPVTTITTNSGNNFSTSVTTVTIEGTCTDAVGCTAVTWVNACGGSGTASGTSTWSFNTTVNGTCLITVTGADAAGNNETTAIDTITGTYSAVVAPTTRPSIIRRRLPVPGDDQGAMQPCADRGTLYAYGDGPPFERMPDGNATQRLAVAARIRQLERSGFWVNWATKSTYTQILASCGCLGDQPCQEEAA